MNSEWYEKTANDLTQTLAAIMHIKPSNADRIVNATVAHLGAAGATAGVFGLAALVGTAGTGTAIGTLSGAAATSATLAWVGGSVFTGTIVVAGIAVAGWWGAKRLWRGKDRKYEDLSVVEQKLVNACATLAKAFREEARRGVAADPATIAFVRSDGLVPLLEKLDDYLRLDRYRQLVTGPLSLGSRSRLLYRKQRLRGRTMELGRWLRGEK